MAASPAKHAYPRPRLCAVLVASPLSLSTSSLLHHVGNLQAVLWVHLLVPWWESSSLRSTRLTTPPRAPHISKSLVSTP